ncbi:MAG: alpha-L-fucosidase [Planctomycetota bacterium]
MLNVSISRRRFMQAAVQTSALLSLGYASTPAQAEMVDKSLAKFPTPTPAQLTWQNCEIGVIFHLDMPLVAGDFTRNNAVRKTFNPQLYNPTKLDTDQWVAAAKSAGAKYAIFTATHFNGFMQWQSDLYPYGLKQAEWRHGKGDIVKDFVNSCHKADVLPGIYFSTHRNVSQSVWGHYVDWGKGKGTEKQKKFNHIAEKMTEELCSRYGPLVQIWYDAGVKLPHEGGPDVLPIFKKYQPNSVFYNSSKRSDHRWIGNEAGHAGYPCWATMPGKEKGAISHNSGIWRKYLHGGDPSGTEWSPGMVDIVLRGKGNHDWFWRPGKDHTVHTVDELMRMYYTSVGRNCNLVIGAVVDNQGLVPDADVKRLGEFGNELKQRFSTPIAVTEGRGNTIELEVQPLRMIDHVVIQEQIKYGERIQEYRIEGLTPGNLWQELAKGQSVGHKRIQQFKPVKVSRVRLIVTQSRAEPRVQCFACYQVG